MIRPRHFFANPETARTNEFQSVDADTSVAQAAAEFDVLADVLRAAGVEVICVDATHDPITPDAIFPNNWLSTHHDGTVVTYPMQPLSRRGERRNDILEYLSREHGLIMRRHWALADYESRGMYLEGTGSLVLDRAGKRAFACISARTHPELVDEFARYFDYQPITFSAYGPSGQPVYHTNVMMCVGSATIVACVDAIADADRDRVVAALTRDHELVEITMAQMGAFAGNMLELVNRAGEAVLVMSARAHAALNSAQRARLSRHARLVSAPINAIEDAAGGSVRCMLAELFLPREAKPAVCAD